MRRMLVLRRLMITKNTARPATVTDCTRKSRSERRVQELLGEPLPQIGKQTQTQLQPRNETHVTTMGTDKDHKKLVE